MISAYLQKCLHCNTGKRYNTFKVLRKVYKSTVIFFSIVFLNIRLNHIIKDQNYEFLCLCLHHLTNQQEENWLTLKRHMIVILKAINRLDCCVFQNLLFLLRITNDEKVNYKLQNHVVLDINKLIIQCTKIGPIVIYLFIFFFLQFLWDLCRHILILKSKSYTYKMLYDIALSSQMFISFVCLYRLRYKPES